MKKLALNLIVLTCAYVTAEIGRASTHWGHSAFAVMCLMVVVTCAAYLLVRSKR